MQWIHSTDVLNTDSKALMDACFMSRQAARPSALQKRSVLPYLHQAGCSCPSQRKAMSTDAVYRLRYTNSTVAGTLALQ